MRTAILFCACLSFGCGKSKKQTEAEPTKTSATALAAPTRPTEPTLTSAIRPAPAPKPAPMPPPPPPPAWKQLTAEAAAEITKAFQENVIAARRAYGKQRWRFTIRPTDPPTDIIYGITAGFNTANCVVYMRSDDEAAKVKLNTPFVVEAVLRDWNPYEIGGVRFLDGVYIGPPPEGEPRR